MSLRRVNKRHPCQICLREDWCGLSEKGGFAICMRIESGKRAKNGGWIHNLDSQKPAFVTPQRIVHSHELASREHLDAIYSTLIRGNLVLSHKHRENLLERGLSDSEIERNGYMSTPMDAFAQNVARSLSQYDLRGVPGFYREHGVWRMVDLPQGFLIPVRDSQNRIRALQIRKEAGRPKYIWFSSANRPEGCSSGAPPHFAHPERIEAQRRVLITEGALKADIISHKLEQAVIGFGGLHFPEGFARKLRRLFPTLRDVQVAFDSDFQSNAAVRDGLFRLLKELAFAGVPSRVLTWDSAYKGLDDYLAA